MRNHFRPEFINRVDDILVFDPASAKEDLRQIVAIQFESLVRRMAAPIATSSWNCQPGGRRVARRSTGYDPSFGARPLKRLLQREIADRLALALLEGRFVDGDTIDVIVRR